MIIDENLAQKLINEQFPERNSLSITPVAKSGWDNRTFHLGDKLSIRIPSSEKYAPQIIKEFEWLPIISKSINFEITKPIALGKPCKKYPWHWSINKWIEGDTVSLTSVKDIKKFAKRLGEFLREFEMVDSTGGPAAGDHNFHRGGKLSVYSEEMSKALPSIKNDTNRTLIQKIWEQSLSSYWNKKPVWVHGDLAIGNILIQSGELKAVIDFGQLAIGDPACDLVMAWNFFDEESRGIFRQHVNLDKDTWIRAMGWALWKTVCWPIEGTNSDMVIHEICSDYKENFT